MSNREIKARMILKGVKSKEIASAAGVTETWVSLVLNGHRKSPRIRKAIADALGVPFKDLWPDRNGAA